MVVVASELPADTAHPKREGPDPSQSRDRRPPRAAHEFKPLLACVFINRGLWLAGGRQILLAAGRVVHSQLLACDRGFLRHRDVVCAAFDPRQTHPDIAIPLRCSFIVFIRQLRGPGPGDVLLSTSTSVD